MSRSITLSAVHYTPAREDRGWNVESADLFLIEGATEYPWKHLPQEQHDRTPTELSQDWQVTEDEKAEAVPVPVLVPS
jgi:hypothetical protein